MNPAYSFAQSKNSCVRDLGNVENDQKGKRNKNMTQLEHGGNRSDLNLKAGDLNSTYMSSFNEYKKCNRIC